MSYQASRTQIIEWRLRQVLPILVPTYNIRWLRQWVSICSGYKLHLGIISCPNLLVCVFEYFLNFTFPFAVDVLQVVASARSRNSRKKQENYTFIHFFYSGNLENKNEKRFNSKPSFRILYRLASIWPYSNITVQGKVYVIPKHSCNFFLNKIAQLHLVVRLLHITTVQLVLQKQNRDTYK